MIQCDSFIIRFALDLIRKMAGGWHKLQHWLYSNFPITLRAQVCLKAYLRTTLPWDVYFTSLWKSKSLTTWHQGWDFPLRGPWRMRWSRWSTQSSSTWPGIRAGSNSPVLFVRQGSLKNKIKTRVVSSLAPVSRALMIVVFSLENT